MRLNSDLLDMISCFVTAVVVNLCCFAIRPNARVKVGTLGIDAIPLLARGEDYRSREKDITTEIPRRRDDVERKKQGGNPPQHVQPNGTLATHNLCLFERLKKEGLFNCMCHPRVAYAHLFHFNSEKLSLF